MKKTLPKSIGISSKTDPKYLVAGRYGTDDMIKKWGPEATFQYSLEAISTAIKTMSDLYPNIIKPVYANEITSKANLENVNPQRIREIEEITRHDVIAIQRALEEQVSKEAAPYIGLAMTSADITETAKAKQIKESIEIIIDSVENLRDVTIEKSMEWINIPYIDQTHMLDALPTVAGRPFCHYAQMLQSDLNLLAYVYKNSVKGKWSDSTGNYHALDALDTDCMKIEREYCKRMGVGFVIGAAQIPGREFIADVMYSISRLAETMNNMAQYIAMGKGDDINVFFSKKSKKRKGSSSMPHKDIKGGNPIVEEQTESFAKFTRGAMSTMLSACEMKYCRDLSASASDRIVLSNTFKWGDFVIRRLSNVVYNLGINEERSIERFNRTFGTTTSSRILTYLTDPRKTSDPMPRSKAHDLLGKLASEAYNQKIPFSSILLKNKEITDRLSIEKIIELTDPMTYIGASKEVILNSFNSIHKRPTL